MTRDHAAVPVRLRLRENGLRRATCAICGIELVETRSRWPRPFWGHADRRQRVGSQPTRSAL